MEADPEGGSDVQRKVIFPGRVVPYVLLAPQLAITAVFFFWPAGQAIWASMLRQDAFGIRTEFVWFENFEDLFADPLWLDSLGRTVLFATCVTALAMGVALLLAALADRGIRGASSYKTLLIWPYALAPAVAAVLWLFLFSPSVGLVALWLKAAGIDWNFPLNGAQAMLMVILAAAWKQVSYNFIFFLAALQSIPRSVLEASAIDGAGPVHRFRTVVLPLIGPTTFFLLVVNLVYAFFDTFGIIHALTRGGPGKSTETLIYKVYVDGVVNLNLGSSSAQSVVLMAIVIVLTVAQFRLIERKVHY